jgi:hypothetical protein
MTLSAGPPPPPPPTPTILIMIKLRTLHTTHVNNIHTKSFRDLFVIFLLVSIDMHKNYPCSAGGDEKIFDNFFFDITA